MDINETPIAKGKVSWVGLNGEVMTPVTFGRNGALGDSHSGPVRALDGHDRSYLRTSNLQVGHIVANLREWTGISLEEMKLVAARLRIEKIPPGILKENVCFEGIPDFSDLPIGARIVFPLRSGMQLILRVEEPHTPCAGVSIPLADALGEDRLKTEFIEEAWDYRGLLGRVYAQGVAHEGDPVTVYPPVMRPEFKKKK